MPNMFQRPDLPIADLAWLHLSATGFVSLGETFATPTDPTPMPAAHWVGTNEALRQALGLPADLWQQQEAILMLVWLHCWQSLSGWCVLQVILPD